MVESALTLTAFSTGVTSLLKKLGISGDWLILVAVLCGGFYSYMTTYQPGLWDSFSGVWLSLAASGNVALFQDLLSRVGKRPAGV